MKLTHTKLRSLDTPGRYFDGAGLYLELTQAGGKYWRMKYRFGGKEKRLAFGVYPAVTLAEARDQAIEARKVMRAGVDPGALRKSENAKAVHDAANTLEAVARAWLSHQSGRWEPITLNRITASLETYIFRQLGNRPAASVKPGQIMAAVKRIEAAGASDQAGLVLQRVKSIYRWAVTHELIEANPMVDLVPSEILRPRDVTHRPALSDADLPDFLARLEGYQGDPHTVRALRLLMLTATRPGEVRGAVWSEFNLDAALWIIPGERMKMKMEHQQLASRSLPADSSTSGAASRPCSPFCRIRGAVGKKKGRLKSLSAHRGDWGNATKMRNACATRRRKLARICTNTRARKRRPVAHARNPCLDSDDHGLAAQIGLQSLLAALPTIS